MACGSRLFVAFREGNVLWLADGFHRWHAHKVIDADGIDVEIIDGSRRDASAVFAVGQCQAWIAAG